MDTEGLSYTENLNVSYVYGTAVVKKYPCS